MAAAPRLIHVLPPEYLTAIGDVIVQWAFFETTFDQAIHFLRAHPKAEELEPQLPNSFKRRTELFKASAEAAFASYPEMLPRFDSLTRQIASLARRRHDLAHSRWAGSADTGYEACVLRFCDWSTARPIPSKLSSIRKLSNEIAAVHLLVQEIIHPLPDRGGKAQLLTSEEISALQRFRSENLRSPPMPLVPPLRRQSSRE